MGLDGKLLFSLCGLKAVFLLCVLLWNLIKFYVDFILFEVLKIKGSAMLSGALTYYWLG